MIFIPTFPDQIDGLFRTDCQHTHRQYTHTHSLSHSHTRTKVICSGLIQQYIKTQHNTQSQPKTPNTTYSPVQARPTSITHHQHHLAIITSYQFLHRGDRYKAIGSLHISIRATEGTVYLRNALFLRPKLKKVLLPGCGSLFSCPLFFLIFLSFHVIIYFFLSRLRRLYFCTVLFLTF